MKTFIALLSLVSLVACVEMPIKPPSSSVPREVVNAQAQAFAASIGGRSWWLEGSSMAPYISEHAVVVTEPAHFDELRPGDVVAYTSHMKTIVHRLRERAGDEWIVAGDANPFVDTDHVTRSNYLGRQCAVFFTE
jgi:signal peptidase I